MKTFLICVCVCSCLVSSPALSDDAPGDDNQGTVLLEDHFDREEMDQGKEQVGNDWGTNSKSRAQGVKQVDLVDGAMHITRADLADHGVSVTHEVAFQDAVIQLRFKLGPKDDLGINIADMNEKSVHAGHICMAKMTTSHVEMHDLKTGRMELKTHERSQANTLSAVDKTRLSETTKRMKYKLSLNEWHDLEVKVVGDKISVAIDGKAVGEFQSPGIGHPTKSRLRLTVNKSAWVDDVKVTKLK